MQTVVVQVAVAMGIAIVSVLGTWLRMTANRKRHQSLFWEGVYQFSIAIIKDRGNPITEPREAVQSATSIAHGEAAERIERRVRESIAPPVIADQIPEP